METLTSLGKNVKLAAGLLGVIQSLAWILLSVACIAMHLAGPWDLTSTTYMGKVQYLMYEFFIQDYHNVTFNGHILAPDAFHVFEWIYFVEDVVWLIASLNVLFRTKNKIVFSLKLWSFVTMIVCIFDLVTVIILGVDYNDCTSDTSHSISESSCANGILPVLIIAAKGFVLWIVDLIFAIILFNISRHTQPQEQINMQQLQTLYSNDKVPSERVSLPRAHHHSPYLAHNGHGQEPMSPTQNRHGYPQHSPNVRGYPRHWSGFSTASDSPKSPKRQSWNSSPVASSHPHPHGMANQKPFVLSPPPKRRH